MKSKELFYVGAHDGGGNNQRFAIADSNGNEIVNIRKKARDIDGKDLPQFIVAGFNDALSKAGETHEIKRLESIVGSQAGLTDTPRGILLTSPNIKDSNGVDLKTPVEREFQTKYSLHNDGNCGALGVLMEDENAKELSCIIYIIMGSGIGGGIVTDRKIYYGSKGLAGEIGHMIVAPHIPHMCGCGKKGCWESFCSGGGFKRYKDFKLDVAKPYTCLNKTSESKDIFAAARNDDLFANELITDLAKYNLVALANLVHLFNPEGIFFGESMLHDEDLILPVLRKNLPGYLMHSEQMPDLYRTNVKEPCLRGAIYEAIRIANNR